MSSQTHDSGLPVEIAAKLRARAGAVGLVYGMLGGMIGAGLAVLIGLRIGVARGQYTMLVVMLVGVVVGFVAGLVVGAERVHTLLVQAHTLRCHLEVERNTATIVHLLRSVFAVQPSAAPGGAGCWGEENTVDGGLSVAGIQADGGLDVRDR